MRRGINTVLIQPLTSLYVSKSSTAVSRFTVALFCIGVCFTLYAIALNFVTAFARVVPGTDLIGAPIEFLGEQTGHSLSWVANLAAGA